MKNLFEIKNGIAELTLEQLSKTTKVMNEMYLPKTRPVHGDTLINMITDKVSTISGVSIKLDAIYVPEKSAKIGNRPGEKYTKENCPLENWIIERFTTKIDVVYPQDQDMNMYFGISYNERGITLAMGVDVWICSNQNVFGGKIMSTFGKDSMPFEKMLQIIDNWVMTFDDFAETDYHIVKRMKEISVSEDAKQLVIGKLFEKAVMQNNLTHVTAPLNQTQVAMLVKNQLDNKYAKSEDQNITVWDINQWGTDALRPHNTDIISMYQNLNAFSDFLINEFNIN